MKASWQLVKNPDYDEAFLRAFTVPVEDWHWTARSKGHCGYRWFRSPRVFQGISRVFPNPPGPGG
jgi:hypothetical protein